MAKKIIPAPTIDNGKGVIYNNLEMSTRSRDTMELGSVKDVTDQEAYDLGRFGNYANVGSVNQYLYNNQGYTERTAKIAMRGMGTFSAAALENLAVIASLPNAFKSAATGEGFIKGLTDNALTKTIEETHKDMLEHLPLYYSDEDMQNPDMMNWITSGQILDDGVQGFAFLYAQVLPMSLVGALTKSATFAKAIGKSVKAGSNLAKGTKILEEAGVISSLFERKALKVLSSLDDATKASLAAEGIDLLQLQKTISNTQRLIDKGGQLTGAVMGRLGESTMERNQTYEELISKGVDPETANRQADNVFLGNLALSVLDMHQYNKIFGGVNKAAKKGLMNEAMEEASKRVDASAIFRGGEAVVNKGKNVGLKRLWNIGSTSVSEGFEEFLQYNFQEGAKREAFEEALQETALDTGSHDLVDNMMDYLRNTTSFFKEVGSGIPESLSTLEAKKSTILGMLLGGGGAALSSMGEEAAINKYANQFKDELNSVSRKAVDVDKLYQLNPNYKKNESLTKPEDIEADAAKKYVYKDGVKLLNNEYLSSLNNFTRLELLKDEALKNKNELLYKKYSELQLLTQASSFASVGKLDDLINKYDEMFEGLSDTDVNAAGNKAALAKELGIPVSEITVDTLNEIKSKITEYGRIINDVKVDPTLSALNPKAQKVAGYRLAEHQINKNILKDINTEIQELETKKITNALLPGLTEQQFELDLSKPKKDLTGLNPLEHSKLEKLKKEREALVNKNKEIFEWYDNIRKPENLKAFNEDVSILKFENKEQNQKQKSTELNNAVVDPKLKSFYDSNTILDKEGFESSEIELIDSEGNSRKYKLIDGDVENLYENGNPKGAKISVDAFLNNRSTRGINKSNISQKENTYNAPIENNPTTEYEDILTLNGQQFVVKVTDASTRRFKKQNERELLKTQARIDTLNYLIENVVKKAEEILKNKKTLAKEKYLRLKEITAQIEEVTDGTKKRSKIYQELVEEKAKLEEEILNLGIEIETLRENRPNIVKRYEELKAEKENLEKVLKEGIKNILTEKYIDNTEQVLRERISENKTKLEMASTLYETLEETINQLDNEKQALTKMVDALDFLIEKIILDNYEKHSEVIHTIMNKYDIKDLQGLKQWFLDFKSNKANYKISDKASNVPYIWSSKEASTVINSVLNVISETELEKYTNELNNVSKKLDDYINVYENLLEANTVTKTKAKFDYKIKVLRNELALYLKQNKALQRYYNLKDETESIFDGKKVEVVVEEDTESFYSYFKNHDGDYILSGGGFTTGLDSTDDWFENPIDAKDTHNPDESRRRYFRWLEYVGYAVNPRDYKLMVVSPTHPEYGMGKRSDIYTDEVKENLTHNEDDLRVIVVNKADNTPVMFADGIVWTNLPTETTSWSNGADKYYFEKGDKKSELQLKIKEFRNFIKTQFAANKPVLLDIDFIVRGKPLNGKEKNNFLGSIITDAAQINDLNVEVSTGEINFASRKVKYPKGRVLVTLNNNGVPAITRRLNSKESYTVINLIKAFTKNFKDNSEIKDLKQRKNKSNEITGLDIKLTTAIKNITFLGKENYPFYLEYKEDGVSLVTEDKVYSQEDLLSGNYDLEIAALLEAKPLQIDKSYTQSKKEHKEIIWNAEKKTFETKQWKTYKHYLFGINEDGTIAEGQPPLTTSVPKLNKPTKEGILKPNNAESGRRFQNGYIAFRTPKTTATATPTQQTKTKTKPEETQTPPVKTGVPILVLKSDKFSVAMDLNTNQVKLISGEFPNELGDEISKDFLNIAKGVFSTGIGLEESIKILSEALESYGMSISLEDNKTSNKKEKEDLTEEPQVNNDFTNPFSQPEESAEEKKNDDDLTKTIQETEALVDVTKQIEAVSNLLGIPIERVEGLIKPGVVGRVLENGRVLVSTIAVEGTPYHEAWHYVSQFLLTDSERNNIYQDYIKRNNLKDKSLREVEEMLADSFMNYMLKKDKETKKSLIGKLFDKIINFLNKLFNNKSQFEKLFEDIAAKKYYGKTKLTEKMNFRYLDKTVVTASDIKQFHAYFTDALFANDAKILFNLDYELSNDIYNTAKSNILKDSKSEDFNLKLDSIIAEHKKYLAALGIESRIEFDDKELEEDEKQMLIAGIKEGDIKMGDSGSSWKESYFSSQKGGLPKTVKLLLSSIIAKTDSETGLKETVDFDKLVNKLHNKLANVKSLENMFKILKESNDNAFNQIVEKLNGGSINATTPLHEVKLIVAFYNQFAKSKENFHKLIVNNNGYLNSDNSNLANKRSEIRNKWLQNQAELVNDPKSGIELVDGEVKLKPQLLDMTINYPSQIETFLNSIGINIDYVNIIDKLSDTEKKRYNQIANNFISGVKKINNLNTLLSLQNNPEKGNLNKLILLEGEYGEENYELQHTTPNGEVAYDISLNSYFTQILNSFLEGDTSLLETDPYAKDSILYQRIKEGRVPERIITEGLTNSTSSVGSDLNKATFSDFLKTNLIFTLKNIYPLLITGDKKTVRAIKLDEPYFEIDNRDSFDTIINNAVKVMYNYYLTEKEVKAARGRLGQRYILGEQKLNKDNEDSGIFSFISKNAISEQAIKNEIKKNLIDTIFNNKQLFINEGVMTATEIKLDAEGNIIKNVLGKTKVSTEQEMNILMAAFTINDMINSIEQTKVIFGHPVYYKDFIDMFKRFAGAIATKKTLLNNKELDAWMDINMPRQDGKTRDGNVKTIVFEDVNGVEEELKALSKTDAIFEEYGKIPATDAFGLILPDDYRDILFKSGDWSEQQDNTWTAENSNDIDITDKKTFSTNPPLKLVVYGSLEKTELKPHYYKFAVLPINERFFEAISSVNEKGEKVYPQLYDMYNKLLDNQIGIAVFKSGNKVGTPVDASGKAQPFYQDGEMADIDENLINDISLDHVGIQVENKPKFDFESQARGTQEAAIVLGNIYNNGQPVTKSNGEPLKSKKGRLLTSVAKQLIDDENTLTEQLIQELEESLGLTRTNKGEYVFNSNNGVSLQNKLIKESERRGLPSNIIDGINNVFKRLRSNQRASLDILPNKEKIHNILASIVQSSTIDQKRPGISAVQFPAIGFEKSKVIGTDANKNYKASELKFYENDGLGISYCEAWLPNHLSKYFPNGEIDINNIPEDLLFLEGFRIPTEQRNSLDIIKIKGFLPAEMGNVIILPPAIAAKVGSDFDFDKTNLYYPNYEIVYNKFTFEKLESFKNSEYFKLLSDNTKNYINSLSLEEFNDYVQTLNKFSVTSGRGEYGNLSESEYFNSLSKEQQDILEDFKTSLVAYNSYKNNLIKNNKETAKLKKETPLIEVKYIDDSYLTSDNREMRIKALQNRLLRNKIEILDSPDVRTALLKPNTTKAIQTIAKELNTIKINKGLTNPNLNYKFGHLLNFAVRSVVRSKFWLGKDLVGIIALHNKNHILAQITGLGITTKDDNFKVNFAGIESKVDSEGVKYYPLGNVYAFDENGKPITTDIISDTLGQELSTCVDAIKTPDTLDMLNMNLGTANVAAMLTRLGVPKKTVFAFLTQPSIVEYIKANNNKNSITIPRYQREVKGAILERIYSKYPEVTISNLNLSQLLEYNNNYQNQILKDFLMYEEYARALSDFQSAASFDTRGFKNIGAARNLINQYEETINSNVIYNARKYEETFLKGFKPVYEKHGNLVKTRENKTTGYFKNLFTMEQQPIVEGLSKLENYFNSRVKVKKNLDKVLNTMWNDFLSYLISITTYKSSSTNKTIPAFINEFEEIFKGTNSVAELIIKEAKTRGDSSPLNNFRIEKAEVNNLRLNTKRINSWEADILTAELNSLPNDVLFKLFKLALLQSGFNNSALNIISVLPSVKFSGTINSILNYAPRITETLLNDFTEKFFLNNINNTDIVPEFRLGRNVKIISNGEHAGKIKHDDKYISKFPFISTYTLKDNVYEHKYWKQVGEYFEEIEPISEGYRFKNWKALPKLINQTQTELPENKPEDTTSSKKPEQLKVPANLQSEVDKAINALVQTYRKLSDTDKIKLKYFKEINNGKGLQNETQFRIFVDQTLKAFIAKNPNVKVEDAKKNLIETLNKCFTKK